MPLYSIPLGSPTMVSKRSYVHAPATPATGVLMHRGDGQAGCTGQGCRQGGYTGWVIRGAIPGPTDYVPGEQTDSEAGPGRPAGPGVGGRCSGRPSSVPTLRARSVTLQVPSLVQTSPRAVKRPCKPVKPQKTDKLTLKLVKPRSVTEKCVKGLP